ncbi:MAG: proline--tRNA ligase, partial [Candidatus Bathyarchaeota archaeon]|nr:proline--tRNA ligase [Candidatus Bathyarchaeota archaeon]
AAVQKIAEELNADLKTNAAALLKEHVFRVNRLSEAKSLLKKRAGIVEVPWCGNDECGHRMEEEVEARLLGFPEDTDEKIDGKCVVCDQPAVQVVRVAQAY